MVLTADSVFSWHVYKQIRNFFIDCVYETCLWNTKHWDKVLWEKWEAWSDLCLFGTSWQGGKKNPKENQQISQHTPSVVSLWVLLYYLGRITLPTRFRAMLKMAPGTGRQRTCLLLHHLVITWRGPKDGAIDLLCQTQQIALQSLVRLSDYSTRCCGDKSCWKLRSCPRRRTYKRTWAESTTAGEDASICAVILIAGKMTAITESAPL